ncbi:MAG: hypothetical protein IT480_04215 [Gammaproteobacteria bacterium]|nr:hypothetical protein [Gammaproteobacteria bacterium]
MSREFILRHQIVERYLAGRLPPKGVQDFERYCAENPGVLDELGLPTAVNAALRLLEVGGRPAPWEERPRRFWEKPQALIGAGTLAVLLAGLSLYLQIRLRAVEGTIAAIRVQSVERPIDPATSTRPITLIPSRTAPSRRDAVVIGGAAAQLADFKIDMSWSTYTVFRVTVDRIDQGRVAVIYNALRDSNGNVHIAINSSALGPGSYQFALEGLNWRGEATPQAWITVGVTR